MNDYNILLDENNNLKKENEDLKNDKNEKEPKYDQLNKDFNK